MFLPPAQWQSSEGGMFSVVSVYGCVYVCLSGHQRDNSWTIWDNGSKIWSQSWSLKSWMHSDALQHAGGDLKSLTFCISNGLVCTCSLYSLQNQRHCLLREAENIWLTFDCAYYSSLQMVMSGLVCVHRPRMMFESGGHTPFLFPVFPFWPLNL